MRNHAIFFAFRKAGYGVTHTDARAERNMNGKGWNANLSYKTAQQLKAQGIIE